MLLAVLGARPSLPRRADCSKAARVGDSLFIWQYLTRAWRRHSPIAAYLDQCHEAAQAYPWKLYEDKYHREP